MGVAGELVLGMVLDECLERVLGAGEILVVEHQRGGIVVLFLGCTGRTFW